MLEFDPDNVDWIGLDPVADDDEDLDVEIIQSKPPRAKHTLTSDMDVEVSRPRRNYLEYVLMVVRSTSHF